MFILCVIFLLVGVLIIASAGQDGIDLGLGFFGLIIVMGSLVSFGFGVGDITRGYPVLKGDRQADIVYQMVSLVELDDGTRLVVVREPTDDLRLFQLVDDDEISSSTNFFKIAKGANTVFVPVVLESKFTSNQATSNSVRE